MSGLVLAAFLAVHFGNHALGLVSLDAMEAARPWLSGAWRHPLATTLLYGSLLLHFLLALHALYRRQTLRMPLKEAAQLALGLLLPFLLVPHVVSTRIDFALTGNETTYPEMVRMLWSEVPANGFRQSLALVVGWLHACLGFYFWLRPKPLFQRYAIVLYTAALLVPVLALLGFAEAGKEAARRPEILAGSEAGDGVASSRIVMGLYLGFGSLIGAALVGRGVRRSRAMSDRIRITYPGGRDVAVPRGFSVLEASRAAGIPHLSVCGGRGRCSTCRVRVIGSLDGQPAPNANEQATLARIGAGTEVRLACQFRPTRDVEVVPVLSTSDIGAIVPGAPRAAALGREREVAVLFCDLRDFTGLVERHLPFDTVFMLNRYFEVVGTAVEKAGGHVDKFVGDGAIALFGVTAAPEQAARQAFEAALRIRSGMADLNAAYAGELHHPLRLAIGLHAGPAILGEMGYGQATSLTAIGDTINVASRLEELAKSLDAELVMSEDLVRRAGLDVRAHTRRTLPIRGRSESLDVWIIRDMNDVLSAWIRG